MKVEIIVFGILLIIVLIFVNHELNFIHEQMLKMWKINFDMTIEFDERLKKLENKKKKNKEEK